VVVRARPRTAERNDPATNTWTPNGSMASARSRFAAAMMGGFLYVTGGAEGLRGGPHIVLRRCERYDQASNTWSGIADLPEPRFGHALACLDGSLYVMGGRTGGGPVFTSLPWRYDATGDALAEVPLAARSAPMLQFEEQGAWTAL
jgi:hypothetical protein